MVEMSFPEPWLLGEFWFLVDFQVFQASELNVSWGLRALCGYFHPEV